MSLRARLVNGIWLMSGHGEERRFRAALTDPAAAQQRLLRDCLTANADTAWGRDHGFAAMGSPDQFAARHPVTRWRDYEPYVERIMAGEANVLTREPVTLLEPSSGSTAACKLVPYTGTLQRQFARAISVWVRQMFRAQPALAAGPAYWSVSPVGIHDRGASTRVPVGFQDDSQYLGGFLGPLVSSVLAVPAAVRHIDDMDTFRYLTLLMLLRAGDLRLISVWHPSFLSLLLAALPHHWDALLADLVAGTLSPPRPLRGDLAQQLARCCRPAPARARQLASLDPTKPSTLWPHLALISCWADGHAAEPAADLGRLFPDVALEPKGLLATEAVVTIPYGDRAPLAVRSHYFEFLAPGGEVLRAEQLQRDQDYTVIVTTGGGLYRYDLGDRVRATGVLGRTPTLRFLGKEDCISDRRGEKLNEGFVAAALKQILGDTAPVFAMLAPDDRRPQPGYTLYVQAPAPQGLAAALENALLANPHYRYCRALSQLQPVRECCLTGNVYGRYAARCVQLGQRLGDVKPVALSARDDWAPHLTTGNTAPQARRACP